MKIAGTGGCHRDGTRPYPHFFRCNTRRTLVDTGTMHSPCPIRNGSLGHRKSGDSHINPVGSYSKR